MVEGNGGTGEGDKTTDEKGNENPPKTINNVAWGVSYLGVLSAIVAFFQSKIVELIKASEGVDKTLLISGFLIILILVVMAGLRFAVNRNQPQPSSGNRFYSSLVIVLLVALIGAAIPIFAKVYSNRVMETERYARAVADLNTQSNQLFNTCVDLTNKVQSLSDLNTNLHITIDSQNAGWIKQFKELREKFKNLSDEVNEEKSKLVTNRKVWDDISRNNEQLVSTNKTLHDEIIRLTRERDQLSLRIGDLFTENQRLENALADFDKGLKKALEPSTTSSDTTKQEQWNDLQQRLGQFLTEHLAIKQKASELEAHLLIYKSTGLEREFEKSREFLEQFGAYTRNVTNQIVFLGFNFQFIAHHEKAAIKALLRRGLTLRFLVCDPKAIDFSAAAERFGGSTNTLADECHLGFHALNDLQNEWEEESKVTPSSGKMEVKYLTSIPAGEIYIFDPGCESGTAFCIPYITRHFPNESSGYLYKNFAKSTAGQYWEVFQRGWSGATTNFVR